jgi:hypothetical protein
MRCCLVAPADRPRAQKQPKRVRVAMRRFHAIALAPGVSSQFGGRKHFGAGPGAPSPRSSGAAERGGGQNRRTGSNKRVPRRAVLGWGEAVRFLFGAGNTWAPQVRLPPKFHSCERDFNALSGWGAGSRVPRLREPFVNYLVARRVVLRFFVCKKRHVMPYICWTGPSYPPSKMCSSRGFGRKYFGPGPGAQNPRFQGAAERDGGQNRRTNPNKRAPRHN